MMDWLMFLTVEPLKTLYQGLYELLQIFIPNRGTALFALSAVTVLLMVPLEKAVRAVVAREQLLESVLAPQIKAIKATSKGLEQHAALKRLYYRYRYSPLYSVRATFGVLVQLPFLLGAYWMLSEYAPLHGDSYGVLKDLSEPDGLLWGVNLLPILMTAINLATAWVSKLSRRDTVQAVVIAVLFLVLLYGAPSALLLYWTTNNTLHFVRAVLKQRQGRGLNFEALRLKVWESLDGWTARIGMPTAMFAALLVVGVVLFLGGVLTHKSGWWQAVYLDAALMIFVLSVPVALRFWKATKAKPTATAVLKQAAVLVLLIFVAFVFFKIGNFEFGGKQKHLERYVLAAVLLLLVANHWQSVVSGIRGAWAKCLGGEARQKHADSISLASVSLGMLSITVFVLIPLRFYAQNFKGLWFTGTSLLAYVLMAIVISAAVIGLVRRVAVPRWLSVMTLMLTTCVVVQSFLWPQQVKEFIGNEHDWLHEPLTWLNLLVWIGLLTAGAWLCFKKRTARKVVILFNALVTTVVAIGVVWQLHDVKVAQQDLTYESVAFDKKNQFDLGQKNIIVLLLDTLSQTTLDSIRASDREEFEALFRGFTRYTNNVGSGPVTTYAVPYIFSGEHARKNEELARYISRIYSGHTVIDDAVEDGWRVRVYSHGELFSAAVANKIDNAVPTRLWGYAKINRQVLRSVGEVVAYNAVPDVLRRSFSMSSEKFDKDKPALSTLFSAYGEDDPQFYRDFARKPFEVTKPGKEFLFYHLHGAHGPFRTDIKGEWIPWDKPEGTQHDQVLGCLRQVQRMFDRLHKIGKFKDSAIVVMSDHGNHGQVKTSYPVVLFKKAGVGADQPMAESNVPMGHKGLLTAVIKQGDLSEVKERVVMDGNSDLWQAPSVVSGKSEEFTPVAQVESSDQLFTTEGFSQPAFWGRVMYNEGVIHFPEARQEMLKFVFWGPAPACNGYVNFEEGDKKTRFFVGKRGIILYQRQGNDLRIKPECEIPVGANIETYVQARLRYGLFDILNDDDMKREIYRPSLNEWVPLRGRGAQEKVFRTGFSGMESWGTWTEDTRALMMFEPPVAKGKLEIKLSPFLCRGVQTQRLFVRNEAGQLIGEWNPRGDEIVRLNLEDFTTEFFGRSVVKITFEMPDARSPQSCNINGDTRPLGMGFKEMRVVP